jgi:hypothetical protein
VTGERQLLRYVAVAALALAADHRAAAQAPPPASVCSAPEFRQFDFWIGRWDVYRTDNDQLIAHSLIERLYGGCAVRENWMPIGGTGGGSLNSWRPGEQKWLQTWTDSGNNWNEYAGGMVGPQMVLTGTTTNVAGVGTPVRMTYEAKPDGSVVQSGYQSADGGKNWSLTYQYAYRPAGASSK